MLVTQEHLAVEADGIGGPGASTILVYGQFDTQPVDALDEWAALPFEPSVEDGCVFARGALCWST
ncbi:MAG: hypothetical protein VX733_02245 [Candidatus Latescibacterota bacterium]|nr:hypothetical protein [Candidatus Latescibacterota bacterium]